MSNYVNPHEPSVAATPMTQHEAAASGGGSWFEAMAAGLGPGAGQARPA